MGISILYVYTCTISKDNGLDKEKQICLSNRESLSGHRCERRKMAAKCEMFMSAVKTCKNLHKTNMTDDQGIQKGS